MSRLVLVHRLWDTPRLFRRLIQTLDDPERPSRSPPPHRLGAVLPASPRSRQIRQRFGAEQEIDLFGFSMGGVVVVSGCRN